MAKILIVEDEEQLARFVELELLHEGYEVSKAFDGREGLLMAEKENFDLILLDIMLPGLNGLEVLRRLQISNPTPTILLTARDAVMDKVSGLDAGAIDYITKPFAIEELLARVRVALKNHPKMIQNNVNEIDDNKSLNNRDSDKSESKNGKQSEGVYVWNKLVLDNKRHEVHYDGHLITLTNREFLMLETLLSNMDIVLSRDTLLMQVCGYDYIGETNVVDVYVRYLRSKIDDVYDVKMIKTVRGVGYVIRSEE